MNSFVLFHILTFLICRFQKSFPSSLFSFLPLEDFLSFLTSVYVLKVLLFIQVFISLSFFVSLFMFLLKTLFLFLFVEPVPIFFMIHFTLLYISFYLFTIYSFLNPNSIWVKHSLIVWRRGIGGWGKIHNFSGLTFLLVKKCFVFFRNFRHLS